MLKYKIKEDVLHLANIIIFVLLNTKSDDKMKHIHIKGLGGHLIIPLIYVNTPPVLGYEMSTFQLYLVLICSLTFWHICNFYLPKAAHFIECFCILFFLSFKRSV